MPSIAAFLVGIFLACQGAVARILVDPATYPFRSDGTVLLVNNTTGDVYISLTSKDNVRLGMPFTCYDPRTFGTGGVIDNGSIEVMAVTEQFTRCRITRTTAKRSAIQPGDFIFSVVYHNNKDQPFHFVVSGDFDLDGDGIATAAERDRVTTLIRAYGGVVDNAITTDTAYLVVGQRPSSPAIKDPPPDAGPGSIVDRRTIDQKRYDELQNYAMQYAIPVLNTNRLLTLVDYYKVAARP